MLLNQKLNTTWYYISYLVVVDCVYLHWNAWNQCLSLIDNERFTINTNLAGNCPNSDIFISTIAWSAIRFFLFNPQTFWPPRVGTEWHWNRKGWLGAEGWHRPRHNYRGIGRREIRVAVGGFLNSIRSLRGRFMERGKGAGYTQEIIIIITRRRHQWKIWISIELSSKVHSLQRGLITLCIL